MPSARLAVILSIRCSPPEQGRLVPRAVAAVGQSMTATGLPLPGPRWTVTNWLVKSDRCSQVLATSLYDDPATGLCGDAPAGLDEHPEHGL
jgi:hypothetical protein